jgi:hypothetical protein
MRFAMMENKLEREEVLAFLKSLADALDGFVSGMEEYVASGAQSDRRHAELALEQRDRRAPGQPRVDPVGHGGARRAGPVNRGPFGPKDFHPERT